MKRINVIGTTGSGKSTFSSSLAKALDYPYIQMDELFWKPNWQESTDDEFIPQIKQAVSGDLWILDGNYSRTNDIKWKYADTIIWIDYSYSRTLLQLFKRTISRALSKKELWPHTGNKETIGRSFFSRKSILVWFFLNYHRNKSRYANLQNSAVLKGIRFVRLRNPKEASDFLLEMKS